MYHICMSDEYISTLEAAKLVGMAQTYIRQLCTTKRIESKKFGHSVMINKASLLAHKQTMDQWRADRANSKRSKANKK
jgi:excisionase family DNA binding protein